MKKAFHICLLLLLSAVTLHSQSLISEEVHTISNELTFLDDFFPRTEGSVNETAMRHYIQDQIEDMGLEYTVLEYNRIESLHSFSGGIETVIPGSRNEELLLIIPLDHDRQATVENSGSVSIALGLHILRKYRNILPEVGLHLVFLGGEHTSGIPTGTRNFLAGYFPEKPVAALYLDIPKPFKTAEMRVSGKNISAPFWFIQRCDNAMQQAGLYSKLMNNEIHAYRLGLSGQNSIINSYLSEEIPAIYLSGDKDSGGAVQEDWLFSMIIFLDSFIRQNANGFVSEWDKNYLYFQSRFFSYLVSETVYVVCIILFFCFVLLYPLIARNRFMRHVKTLGHNGNHILFYTLGTVLISLFVNLFTELLIILRGTTAFINDFPLLVFLFQTAANVLLIYALIQWIVPGPQNGTFYSALALVLLLLDILLIGFIDISFTYVFIWAFFWAFMLTITKSAFVKRICFLLSPVLLLKSCIDFLSIDSPDLKNLLFRNLIPGIFFRGLLVLPFVLLVFRLRMLGPKSSPVRRHLFIGLASATILVFSLLIFFISPGEKNAEISEYIQTDIQKRLVILKSEYPLQRKSIPAVFTKKNRYTYVHEEDYDYSGLVVEKKEARFLSRRKITFTIRAPEAPDTISVLLTTRNNILIYNSRYPFTIDPRNNSAQIIIGKNPPNPLVFDIVVPEDFSGSADFRIRYLTSPAGFSVNLPGYAVRYKAEIKSVFSL